MPTRRNIHRSCLRVRAVVTYACLFSLVFVTFLNGMSHAAHGMSHMPSFHGEKVGSGSQNADAVSERAPDGVPCHNHVARHDVPHHPADDRGDHDPQCLCCTIAGCITGMVPQMMVVGLKRVITRIRPARTTVFLPSSPWRLERPPKSIIR